MDIRTGFLLFILVILGAVSTLLVLPLLQYVLAAGLLAFVLFPLHEWLARRRFEVRGYGFIIGPRISAGIVTAFAIVAAIVPVLALSIVLLRTIRSFIQNLDESVVIEAIRDLLFEFGMDDVDSIELQEYLLSELEQLIESIVNTALQEALRLLNVSIRVGIGLLVLLFLLYYFLLDGRRLIAWLGTTAPLDATVRRKLFDEVDSVTRAVMKSHVFVAVVEGVLGGIGLYLLGVPNVAFWTVVMIVVSFLPAIGIWLVWAPAVGYLLIIGQPGHALVLLFYGIAVLSVVDNYLRAVLVDRDTGVHSAVVLVGVIGGIYLFGILGLFLGPVLLAVFKAAIEVFAEVYVPEADSR